MVLAVALLEYFGMIRVKYDIAKFLPTVAPNGYWWIINEEPKQFQCNICIR